MNPTTSKPPISETEVTKAQALAGLAAGQTARAQGANPAAIKALASFGKSTFVGELELHPLCLQVQLCLMQHAELYDEQTPETGALADLKRMTRMAYIFAMPEKAYETLTLPGDPAEVRREFDQEAFLLARHFPGPEQIDLLTAHISAQFGLLEAASPAPPEEPPPAQKKTVRRTRPPGRR